MRTYVVLKNNELEYFLIAILMMITPFKIKMKSCNYRTKNLEYQMEDTGVLTALKINKTNFKKKQEIGRLWKMEEYEDPELTSSHRHTEITEPLLMRKSRIYQKGSSTAKDIKKVPHRDG